MMYEFQNPDTGEIIEVEQGMNEPHIYKENGKEFTRIFSLPHLATEGLKHNPFSTKQFLEKTKKQGSVGDLMDRAQDLAAERKQIAGYDPFEAGYEASYSKNRKGSKLGKKLEEITI